MAIKNPSKYQLAIFDTYKNTKSNICITASPGSGKTTTIVEMLNFVKPYKKVAFLAFNKSIVEELKTRIHLPHIDISTLHSLGMKALMRRYSGKVKLNEYKNIYLLKRHAEKEWAIKLNEIDQYMFHISKLIDIYRLTKVTTKEDLIQSAIQRDVFFTEQIIKHALEGMDLIDKYNDGYQEQKHIDFIDMIYLPATREHIALPQYDEVFVDEFQDVSRLQQDLIKKILKANGRFIIVGDPKQSIYLFQAADINSFKNFQSQPNTVTLPLSISYRCPKRIVHLANTVWPVIEAFEGNEDGEIRDGTKDEIKDGDFVLCRNNRPLVELYFELIAKEQKCFIRGKDIGENLIRLVKPFVSLPKVEGLDRLYYKLEELENELFRRGVRKVFEHPRYLMLREKIDVIEVVASKYNTLQEVYDVLHKMFSDNAKGIALQSIHKSKGLEADNIFLLQKSLIPSKYAKSPDQLEQEQNLLYVAYTRAKKKLIFID